MVEIVAMDRDTVILRVPMRFRTYGGQKQVVTSDGVEGWVPLRARVDSTMVKALARAIRWRRLLESGAHASVGDLAAAEKINTSYVSRVLRLTLLAPDIVEAILDGRQPATMTLAVLMKPFPIAWVEQRVCFQVHPQR